MKKIYIPIIEDVSEHTMMEDVEILMDSLPRHYLDNQPWPEFKTNCQASFSVAHSGRAILLKFYVQEDVIKVTKHSTNGQVHKDNCVEFFIAFEPEQKYYNIEMNCVGICLMAYGAGRSKRKMLSESGIDSIQRRIRIQSAAAPAATNYEWQITLVIPIEVFEFSDMKSLTGQKAVGNFFKCGDDLPTPHFLTWNMIEAAIPDFHSPCFFGELQFA